ncbi:hypothetical protein VTO42DRAFT_9027 [Malbranchea cinnamomea]
MNFESTPDLSASTSSWSSAPSSTPCPPYKSYRPTPSVHMTDSNCGTTSTVDHCYLPSGEKSLSGISIRSFFLGQIAGLSFLSTLLLLLLTSSPLWRAPFFLLALCIFHFLEFYITARYNTSFATLSSFLLTQNGAAYNIAHTSAMAECLLSRLLLPHGYFSSTSAIFGGAHGQVSLGLVFIVVGQVVRTLAMAQAGTNFTHTIQYRKREGHVLVTHGIYALLRHPSYFGFFWWGLGTQLVLGNVLCLVGYAVVLWRFFSDRIQKEEQLLIRFFGKEYIDYRARTRVGIPGIP